MTGAFLRDWVLGFRMLSAASDSVQCRNVHPQPSAFNPKP